MARKNKEGSKKSSKTAEIVILPGIYNETLLLLAQAHDYFYQFGEAEQSRLNERERILYASELSRITIRLSCVMAWLMGRKAIFMGKITPEEANEHYRLDCRDVGLNQHAEAESVLPQPMLELLGRSFELFQRVARLDEASLKA
jgi:regulator of CtrA degradation